MGHAALDVPPGDGPAARKRSSSPRPSPAQPIITIILQAPPPPPPPPKKIPPPHAAAALLLDFRRRYSNSPPNPPAETPFPATPPPPQRGCHSPPALVDDAMREIFKRVPPDDPRTLGCAAAVCTSWHGILSDADFIREYRAFHRAPPMLGFLLNTRHGKDEDFFVCDLVTYDRWGIKAGPDCGRIIWNGHYEEEENEDITWDAAVLCAKDGCDHIYCHGEPSLVALVGSSDDLRMTFATFYSSKTRKWSDMISIQGWGVIEVIVGNKVYFQRKYRDIIVEYNMVEQKLSAIDLIDEEDEYLIKLGLMGLEDDWPELELMGAEDGMLLFATVLEPKLYLWSMEVGLNGAVTWAQRRAIELEPLLPSGALFDVSVVGFAEGVGVIFLSTKAGLYTIELSSGRCKKEEEIPIIWLWCAALF
ncbi:hypothetical protein D1007_01914 [Hordeum vulgare]|nr:hypothetical protein D1007_01914 [Hordeum vulgare]